jgi:DNA-binding NtrC family response regulator
MMGAPMNMEPDNQPRLLIADDVANIRQLLTAAFKDRGFEVAAAANGDEAVRLLEESLFDVVITDLKMPGKDGLQVLRAAKQQSVDTAVIVITAYGTMETAVEAMRLGAFDFIGKPFKLAEIELKVAKALQEQDAAEAPPTVTTKPAAKGEAVASGRIIGASSVTANMLKMIQKIAPSKSSVLITGPSGTGKELVAKEIHFASDRRDKPFVALNCAALAPGVLESELFGHEKGAFTGAVGKRVGRFEKAHTGTLFLDEVGEIDPNIQTKLLRVLQESEFERVGGTGSLNVDVRIIAATNRDLREAIRQGLFREDFYYRLNVFSLTLEPLCNRTEDIPALVDHFLQLFNKETGKGVTEIDDDVMTLFSEYPWPGNVRELENVLERAVVLADGHTITRDEIPPEMFYHQSRLALPAAGASGAQAAVAPSGPQPSQGPNASDPLSSQLDQIESETIYQALEKFRWNKTKAAQHLGLKRTTLQYKIKKYGLE